MSQVVIGPDAESIIVEGNVLFNLISNHAALEHLDFAASGHTGFASAGHTHVGGGGGSGAQLDVVNTWTARQIYLTRDALPDLGGELLTNGEFVSNLSGWTNSLGWTWGTSGSPAAGSAVHTGAGADTLAQDISFIYGVPYLLTITLGSNGTDPTVNITFDNQPSFNLSITGPGTFTTYVVPVNPLGADRINIFADVGWNAIVQSISLKQVTGPLPSAIDIQDATGFTAYEIRAVGPTMAIGLNAGGYGVEAGANIAIGENALALNVTGGGNLAFGNGSLSGSLTASYNTGVGENTLAGNNGSNNVGIGNGSLQNNYNGDDNLGFGANSGHDATGSRSIFIGPNAGYSETGSDKLHIGNNPTLSLITGTMGTTAAAQVVQFNALTVILPYLPTSATGLPSGAIWRDSAAGNVLKVVP